MGVGRLEGSPRAGAGAAGRSQSDPLVGARFLEEVAGSWRKVLRIGEEEGERRRLEAHLEAGFPVGPERWIRGLEAAHNRRLHPGRPGRPKKETASAPKNR